MANAVDTRPVPVAPPHEPHASDVVHCAPAAAPGGLDFYIIVEGADGQRQTSSFAGRLSEASCVKRCDGVRVSR